MLAKALVLLRQDLFLCRSAVTDQSNSSIARPARDLARPIVLEDQQRRENEGNTVPRISRRTYHRHWNSR